MIGGYWLLVACLQEFGAGWSYRLVALHPRKVLVLPEQPLRDLGKNVVVLHCVIC